MEKLIEIYKRVILIEDSELFNNGIHEFLIQLKLLLTKEAVVSKTEQENLEGYVRQLDLLISYNKNDKIGQFSGIVRGTIIAITGLGLSEISDKYGI